MKALARARHETLNRRLKQFRVLSERYRNERPTHAYVFHAVCNIVQLDIMTGSRPFQVEYYDGGGVRRRLFDEQIQQAHDRVHPVERTEQV